LYAPPSLNQLSVMLGLHPVTISRQFHHYYACTLGEYIRKLRVEKALTLIKEREHSLTEIAFASGFADQSHFIRAFKRFTGLLPLAYKKNKGC
jgi:AraC family transcriptional regulator